MNAAHRDELRFPSIEGLRAFEAAARLGSFERAAEELHVTASAVGKRIATLEALLGTQLFTRGTKSLALTATGREYLQQAGQALALLAAMPLHRRSRQRVHKLRVRTPPTFARQVLVPRLAGFTEAHPEVELEIVLSTPFLPGDVGAADVEVRHDDEAAEPLLRELTLPMAAPALLARLRPLRRPADLAQAPLLRSPIEPWLPWFRAAGLAWPEPANGPRLVDLGLTLEAAACGQGVALGRPSLALPWLRSGALRPLFGVMAEPAASYHLLPHAAGGPAAAFAGWLRGACAQAQAESQAVVQAVLSGGG